ncbi:MAG: WYL domain-containing protein [Paludibacter sp.]|nr:WYL domain-containing protein [Bacteroidales bacterium]MCM1069615.1 WYL domain-containing protein [Prevotella sp.]MCM1354261.1 WYL domain-containing protein [Bacteroides sp.]MCM1443100.1 WYL domain-containing protein [Muribaculum sp.]MCM1482335.1 WYL domain-containing protein [Paludibacter sp.]
MRVLDKFKEYIWLVNTIHKAQRITFEEIQAKWLDTDMSGGIEYAKSTFHRHKDAIQDIFGLNIECDRKDGYKYFIENTYVLQEDSIQNWMLNTLSVNNIISENLTLQDRIVLENIPCEQHLQLLIMAMKKKVRVNVTYLKYGAQQPSHSDFEPYCIKLFERRWYVLGHFHRDATLEKEERDYFALFSFDRIVDISISNIKFELRPHFDAKTYFAEYWGVLIDNAIPIEHIVLRAYGMQSNYLRDLPLHSTQTEINTHDTYADFSLHLRPTSDFISKLMSMGKHIKILEPIYLVKQIQLQLQEACKLYDTLIR